MSAPARRCQKVSPWAGENSASTAMATNRRPIAIWSNDSPRTGADVCPDGGPATSARPGRDQHRPALVVESCGPAIRREPADHLRLDRQKRAADSETGEEISVGRGEVDSGGLADVSGGQGMLAVVDEGRALGHEPDLEVSGVDKVVVG